MSQDEITVQCPACGALVTFSPAARHFPFCSRRCRLLDLDKWFTGEHRIEGVPELPCGPARSPDEEN